jgi:hypothetical protein
MTLSEKEKMLAGELYRSTDAELQAEMAEAQQHLRRLNTIPNEDVEQRFTALQAILGQVGSGCRFPLLRFFLTLGAQLERLLSCQDGHIEESNCKRVAAQSSQPEAASVRDLRARLGCGGEWRPLCEVPDVRHEVQISP